MAESVPEAKDQSGPDPAEEMFGAAADTARKYAELLVGAGVEQGIVGPAEADRIWDRHLLNCGAIAHLVPAKGALVDLGSGAGLPGVVLAILLPGVRVTLLEAMARRVDFLQLCVAELGLSNAEVVRGRAEDLAGHMAADVVTARAVAPLDKLAGLCVGIARPGGRILAMKGASAEAEVARARPVLGRLGISDARVLEVGSAHSGAATVVMFSAPEHRSDRPVQGRGQGRPGGPTAGPIRGKARNPGAAAGGRKSRPNSRRSGG